MRTRAGIGEPSRARSAKSYSSSSLRPSERARWRARSLSASSGARKAWNGSSEASSSSRPRPSSLQNRSLAASTRAARITSAGIGICARNGSLPFLAQDALVAHPEGDAFLVEPLGERDGELPALAGQLLEALRVDRAVLLEVLHQPRAQIVERGGREPQLLADLHRPALGGQRLEQLLGPLRRLLRQRGQLVGAGRGETRGLEHRGELLLGVGVGPGERRGRAGRPDALGVLAKLSRLGQLRERAGEEARRG